MAEGEGKTEWHYFSGCEQGDQKTSQVYACENNGENISAISNWNTSFWEGKKLIKIVKVFLPALAKVEDTVQIESHKSPQAFWLICKAGGSLARKKKSNTKMPLLCRLQRLLCFVRHVIFKGFLFCPVEHLHWLIAAGEQTPGQICGFPLLKQLMYFTLEETASEYLIKQH